MGKTAAYTATLRLHKGIKDLDNSRNTREYTKSFTCEFLTFLQGLKHNVICLHLIRPAESVD